MFWMETNWGLHNHKIIKSLCNPSVCLNLPQILSLFYFSNKCDSFCRFSSSALCIAVFHQVCQIDWAVPSLSPQVAARSECGVRRRAQAASRSTSKRKSRFSSLWGLDTTSKKKTKAHPSIDQVSSHLVEHASTTPLFLKYRWSLGIQMETNEPAYRIGRHLHQPDVWPTYKAR